MASGWCTERRKRRKAAIPRQISSRIASGLLLTGGPAAVVRAGTLLKKSFRPSSPGRVAGQAGGTIGPLRIASLGASATGIRNYVIARAIAKAADAAAPPISIVWKALRSGAIPVKCPLIHPKSPSATTVTATDTVSARGTLASAM